MQRPQADLPRKDDVLPEICVLGGGGGAALLHGQAGSGAPDILGAWSGLRGRGLAQSIEWDGVHALGAGVIRAAAATFVVSGGLAHALAAAGVEIVVVNMVVFEAFIPCPILFVVVAVDVALSVRAIVLNIRVVAPTVSPCDVAHSEENQDSKSKKRTRRRHCQMRCQLCASFASECVR